MSVRREWRISSRFICHDMFWVRDKSFYKNLIVLAVPIILQNVISFGVSLADNIMIGQLGEVPIAALHIGTKVQGVLQIILFGVESANQETLDRYCKALKVEDVEKGARWATEAGLDVHVTFMFGHPWEGPKEIANTVALARRLLAKGWAKTLQCTLTIPYPGTPLFKELAASDGLFTTDWDEYDMRRAIMKTPLATEDEIKRAIRDVYRGFLQPAALWHRLTSTRTLLDFGFYYRGVRSLIGHLVDFKGDRS